MTTVSTNWTKLKSDQTESTSSVIKIIINFGSPSGKFRGNKLKVTKKLRILQPTSK